MLKVGAARELVADRLDRPTIERLERFANLLLVQNTTQNLVSRETTIVTLWDRHILDSVQLLTFVDDVSSPWLDIGTGAGFPGLVCAIGDRHRQFHLLEPRRQRAQWLQRAAQKLELENVTVHQKRAQVLEPMNAAIVSARAVANLDSLVNMAARHSSPSTIWLFPKGKGASAELKSVQLHDHRLFHVEQSLTDPTAGIIIRRPVMGEAKP